ncbi:MAG: 16S rRNA (adenine(1518)-N(6)/adenine(1519)-N(6))-dimethyltransferase RsmA [Bacteroidales bacterium]|nr:16S rRNA (adenine(1518)-N(6)/adenine(1519)-N(6))-dimethyltransferase RsmA [Bacteroidales bacterium]
MSDFVRAKKHLGQHFLRDEGIAMKTAESLSWHQGYKQLLEIGPGTGMLTKYLIKIPDVSFYVIEVDTESISYLNENFPVLHGRIIEEDFLRFNPETIFQGPFGIVGNFPYNISTQILFRVMEYRNQIPEVVGMFQKEVAERLAEKPGSKTYGITSVLLQAFYDIEYLFTVGEGVFVPPPKVKSAVIRLKRNSREHLDCNEKMFFTVVKTAFNQRRKTLRNSLKPLLKSGHGISPQLLELRPERLSVEDFIGLTLLIEQQQ